MNKHESPQHPIPLARVVQSFERWRRNHRPRARFPEALWSEAVAIARQFGHNRAAQALGLDYYSLKRRLQTVSAANGEDHKIPPSFVELIPSCQPECAIELEHEDGRKMRITHKGGRQPDLVSLCRSFWRDRA